MHGWAGIRRTSQCENPAPLTQHYVAIYCHGEYPHTPQFAFCKLCLLKIYKVRCGNILGELWDSKKCTTIGSQSGSHWLLTLLMQALLDPVGIQYKQKQGRSCALACWISSFWIFTYPCFIGETNRGGMDACTFKHGISCTVAGCLINKNVPLIQLSIPCRCHWPDWQVSNGKRAAALSCTLIWCEQCSINLIGHYKACPKVKAQMK